MNILLKAVIRIVLLELTGHLIKFKIWTQWELRVCGSYFSCREYIANIYLYMYKVAYCCFQQLQDLKDRVNELEKELSALERKMAQLAADAAAAESAKAQLAEAEKELEDLRQRIKVCNLKF